jgi:hypothetical protein
LSQQIMEASYRLLKTFGTQPRYNWRHGSTFLSVFINNTNPILPLKLGILFCSLNIYKPMPLPTITTPLCILSLVSHTNASFSHSISSKRESIACYG